MNFQNNMNPITDTAANPMMTRKANGKSARGIFTFMEKALTTKVGTMIPMVIMFKVFINTLRLFPTMEPRASMSPVKMLE